MTRYLKFNEIGLNPVEAPKQMVKDGKLILGYNKPSNEEMLLADGYIPYDGYASLDKLELHEGMIAEIVPIGTDITPEVRKIFTKLQIRRAMRALECEDVLDSILTGNTNFAKDWADAQEINLDDLGFKQGLQDFGISQEFVNDIIGHIE